MRSPSVGLEWVRFFVVGISITFANLILYMLSVFFIGLPPTIAAALIFMLLIPLHFYSQCRVVFQSDEVSLYILFRYFLALAVSFALNVGLVDFYWRILLAEPIAAQILGLIPAIIANYLLFKFFVFRTSRFSLETPIYIIASAIVGLILYGIIIFILLYLMPKLLLRYGAYYNSLF